MGVDAQGAVQLPLPLRWKAAMGKKDFFVSAANIEAVRFLDDWSSWAVPVALLIGPSGAGKSHLAKIFVRRANARLIDGADHLAREEELFHAWNDATETRRPLLLTARSTPADWGVALPDLRSRLMATPQVRIGAPDDPLLLAVFGKLWRDRGVRVSPDVARYVIARIERSFEMLARVVDEMDRISLAGQRPITIPVVREALGIRTDA